MATGEPPPSYWAQGQAQPTGGGGQPVMTAQGGGGQPVMTAQEGGGGPVMTAQGGGGGGGGQPVMMPQGGPVMMPQGGPVMMPQGGGPVMMGQGGGPVMMAQRAPPNAVMAPGQMQAYNYKPNDYLPFSVVALIILTMLSPLTAFLTVPAVCFAVQSKKSLKAGNIRLARNQGVAAVYLCICAMIGFMFTAVFFTAMLPALV